MADEKTTEYVLLSDGARHKGRRYAKGAKIALDDETGARLLASGDVRLPGDGDDETAAVVVAATVAGEASTVGATQTVTDAGDVKPGTPAHPDAIAATERAVEKVEATARPAGSTGAGKATSKHAAKPAAAKPAAAGAPAATTPTS